MLKGKNILIGVTGGVAAFKAAALTSQLKQDGAHIKVIMTESAKQFVTPLTFQALSRDEVYDDVLTEPDPTEIAHIQLANWADAIVIAPATANTIGKLANGIADDMLSTTVLATKAPVYIAPAMNVHMYDHPAVQRNLKQIVQDGHKLIEGEEGYLACGWTGKGRMAEPKTIISVLKRHFTKRQGRLSGKNVLITAGPTQEKIDPVRYFTNHSSGKMGYALAQAAKEEGANVTLISGQTSLLPPSGVTVESVTSAQHMYEAVLAHFEKAHIVIKAAAVADYRPKVTYEGKRKKTTGPWIIEMERTIDILQTLGQKKKEQILVGFAAETENVEENARRKLKQKNLDMIVANDISKEGAGFKKDTNIVKIITKEGDIERHPLLLKEEVASLIIEKLVSIGTKAT